MVIQINQKGFAFLLATIIIAGVVTVILISTQVGFEKQELNELILLNARNEIQEEYSNYFYSDKNILDLNNNLNELSRLLNRRAFSQGHSLQLCFVAFDQDKNFVLGNFTGQDCVYKLNGVNQGTLGNNSTTTLGSITASTDKIEFCDCNFDANRHKTTFLWNQLTTQQSEINLQWYTGLELGESGFLGVEASCSDNVQNQGETGIDCGGPCPACPPVLLQTTFESGACGAGKTAIVSMTDLSNAHAGTAASHTYKICLKTDTGGCNITAGTGSCIFEMAATSNAHISECGSGYPQTIRASTNCGTISCAYRLGANPCTSDENALASMAASVNSHIAEAAYYNRKICCKIS